MLCCLGAVQIVLLQKLGWTGWFLTYEHWEHFPTGTADESNEFIPLSPTPLLRHNNAVVLTPTAVV